MDIQERDQLIATLISDGNSLSDVQKILKTEHGLQLTYMELRMISSDLEVSWEKIDASKVKEEDKIVDPSKIPDDAGDDGGSGTVVTVSKVVRPGAVMSGDVKFKSGATAEWQLDPMGRLGLNPTNSEKPSEEDLQEFQMELQKALQGKM